MSCLYGFCRNSKREILGNFLQNMIDGHGPSPGQISAGFPFGGGGHGKSVERYLHYWVVQIHMYTYRSASATEQTYILQILPKLMFAARNCEKESQICQTSFPIGNYGQIYTGLLFKVPMVYIYTHSYMYMA